MAEGTVARKQNHVSGNTLLVSWVTTSVTFSNWDAILGL